VLDWLIVGGGIHGTSISNALVKTGKSTHENLRVVDPHPEPLAVWNISTSNTGMEYLRSPGEHNLDIGSGGLKRFARERHSGNAEFYSRYQRPTLALFNAHCKSLIKENDLAELRINATALSLKKMTSSFVLQTTSGEIESKRIILAIGSSDCLSIPTWAEVLIAKACPVAHIFSPHFKQQREKEWGRAAVIGGGISAVQLALSLAKEKPGKVILIHSKVLKTNQFDADPCWLDARCLRLIKRQSDFGERRRIVDNARHWGSFPEEIRRELDLAIRKGALVCRLDSVLTATGDQSSVKLKMSSSEETEAELVVLATGHKRCLPGGNFIKQAINKLDLPCAPCGFPVADEYLRWSYGLFVTGPLAELVIGPASRNIIGARFAGQRIISAEVQQRQQIKELKYSYFERRRTG